MSYMCGEYMFIYAYISYMCMVYICVWYVCIYCEQNYALNFQYFLACIYSWALNIMVAQYNLTNRMAGMGGWAVCRRKDTGVDKWVDDERMHGDGFWWLCVYRSSKGLHMPGSSGFGMVSSMSSSSLTTYKAFHVGYMPVPRAGCSPVPSPI